MSSFEHIFKHTMIYNVGKFYQQLMLLPGIQQHAILKEKMNIAYAYLFVYVRKKKNKSTFI